MLSLRSPHTFALSDKQQVFTSYYAIRHGDWREDRDGRQIYAISHVTVTYDMRKRCQYISRRTTSRNADVSLPILSRDKTETHCRKLLTHDENKTQTSCVLINVLRKTSDKQRAGWKNGRDYSRHIAGGGNSPPPPKIWQRELSTWARNKWIERGMSNVVLSARRKSLYWRIFTFEYSSKLIKSAINQ